MQSDNNGDNFARTPFQTLDFSSPYLCRESQFRPRDLGPSRRNSSPVNVWLRSVRENILNFSPLFYHILLSTFTSTNIDQLLWLRVREYTAIIRHYQSINCPVCLSECPDNASHSHWLLGCDMGIWGARGQNITRVSKWFIHIFHIFKEDSRPLICVLYAVFCLVKFKLSAYSSYFQIFIK